jgi:hypothetical protein
MRELPLRVHSIATVLRLQNWHRAYHDTAERQFSRYVGLQGVFDSVVQDKHMQPSSSDNENSWANLESIGSSCQTTISKRYKHCIKDRQLPVIATFNNRQLRQAVGESISCSRRGSSRTRLRGSTIAKRRVFVGNHFTSTSSVKHIFINW